MRKVYQFFALLVLLPAISKSQSAPKLSEGYYSVVASFSPHHQDYAQKMVSKLGSIGRTAKYGFDPNRNYWYVYTYQSSDKESCRAETKKLQSEPAFSDAWIHSINQGKSMDEDKIVVREEIKETPPPTPQVEEKKPSVDSSVVSNPPTKPDEPQNLNKTQVFLSLFNTTTNEAVDGEVEVVDPDKPRILTKVKGNEYLMLPNPGNKSGKILLISNVFGFRKEELEVNYKNTEADTLKPYVKFMDKYYMINFGLVRIHKGDISTLYNVYFFNDAAIMLPTSQYQLNSLLKLLNDNPTMKIILHGHTNGGGGGKIIYMGPSKNFFAITKDVKNDTGSAKELSNARAEVIREWLLAQGIDPKRIEVKGWGGAKMIYDKDSQLARKNIRVDVEVTAD